MNAKKWATVFCLISLLTAAAIGCTVRDEETEAETEPAIVETETETETDPVTDAPTDTATEAPTETATEAPSTLPESVPSSESESTSGGCSSVVLPSALVALTGLCCGAVLTLKRRKQD